MDLLMPTMTTYQTGGQLVPGDLVSEGFSLEGAEDGGLQCQREQAQNCCLLFKDRSTGSIDLDCTLCSSERRMRTFTSSTHRRSVACAASLRDCLMLKCGRRGA